MTIKYIIGDATEPQGTGPRVIMHCCNDAGKWGRGFVLALSARWPQPEQAYREWARVVMPSLVASPTVQATGRFGLGEVQFVQVEPELWVANIIGQHGISIEHNQAPIRYGALRDGFDKVRVFALHHKAAVVAPRLGAGLAGGKWQFIESLILSALHDVQVTVYDLGR